MHDKCLHSTRDEKVGKNRIGSSNTRSSSADSTAAAEAMFVTPQKPRQSVSLSRTDEHLCLSSLILTHLVSELGGAPMLALKHCQFI